MLPECRLALPGIMFLLAALARPCEPGPKNTEGIGENRSSRPLAKTLPTVGRADRLPLFFQAMTR
jgi:hypothetical protein